MLDIERALVICAHPDDEVLGLGGTIKKMTNAGIQVDVLMFANGNEGYTTMEEKDRIVDIRRKEREAVQQILGIRHFENEPMSALVGQLCGRWKAERNGQ